MGYRMNKIYSNLNMILTDKDLIKSLGNAVRNIHEQNENLLDVDRKITDMQASIEMVLQKLEDGKFLNNEIIEMFSMLDNSTIYEHCESRVEQANMKSALKALKECKEQIDCININSFDFAGSLVENLTKMTGKSWVLANEDNYYCDHFDIKIASVDNKDEYFYIMNSKAWFAGVQEKMSVRDLYLTVPLTDADDRKLETYCDLAEVLEIGLFNFDREKIEQNLSRPNTLYKQIPELEEAVNLSMFNQEALQELKLKNQENEEQMFL